MSSSTYGITKAQLTVEEVLQCVRETLDSKAAGHFSDINNGRHCGDILFSYKGENRRIFVCQTTDRNTNTECDGVLHTDFSLGATGYSVEIMQKLIACWGGYVQDNGSSDVGYYPIQKDSFEHLQALEVTMEDIYEKFGRIVVIKGLHKGSL